MSSISMDGSSAELTMAQCKNCMRGDEFAVSGEDERAIHLHESCRGDTCDCTHILPDYVEPPGLTRLREEGMRLPPGAENRGRGREKLDGKPITPKGKPIRPDRSVSLEQTPNKDNHLGRSK